MSGRFTVSSRDESAMADALARDASRRLGGAAVVTHVRRPEGNGMSSDTVLFDVAVGDDVLQLVARVAPDVDDVPVFPTYELEQQFDVMRLVSERSDVPVPGLRWLDRHGDALGAPLFVMDRIDGRVPADNPPYTFEGWLVDASADERAALQDDAIWTLAGVHGADVTADDVAFLQFDLPGRSALHRHVEWWRRYYEWMRGDARIPVVDDAFAWMERHWPADDGGPAVISWGDARIGNIIFDGFRPAAVLDWEMAAVAPRGVDLGWMVFIHWFFQDVAEVMGLDGVPDLFRLDESVDTYALRSGVEVDLQFWLVYAALRYAVILVRVNHRMAAFGEGGQTDHRVMFEDLFRRVMETGRRA